jgi:L-lactate dehydrogenase (cytochrome)
MAARRLPKPKDLAAWITPRRPQLDPTARRLAQAYTCHDLRRLAARRTPRAIFDYVDGSAEYELTLRRAWRLFRRVELVPQVLQDVRGIDPVVTWLGQTAALPWVLSPAGLTGAIHPGGEIAVARSAARFGVPYGVSQFTTTAIGEVAAQAPGARLWMGAVMPRPDQRDQAKRFFDQAHQAGCEALVVTLDIDTPGSRFRDRKNGLSFPPRLSAGAIADAALHPAWWLDFLTSGPIDLPHVFAPDAAPAANSDLGPPATPPEPSNAFQTVADFAWLVQAWGGPVIAKGLNTARDARLVTDAGAGLW